MAFGSNSVVLNAHASTGRGIKQSEAKAGAGIIKSEEPFQSPGHDVNRSPRVSMGTKDMLEQKMPNFSNSSTSLSSPPSSGAYFSASDPVLLPSHDSRPPSAVGTIRREVSSQRSPSEHLPTNSNGSKTATGKPTRTCLEICPLFYNCVDTVVSSLIYCHCLGGGVIQLMKLMYLFLPMFG